MSDDGSDAPQRIERIAWGEVFYPRALERAPGAPRTLHVIGGARRMRRLLDARTVAIVGTRRASDYGLQTARGLARELAVSGVTVLGGLDAGIAAATHTGALEGGARTLTVMPGGVDVCQSATLRALHRQLCSRACAISQLPCGMPPIRRALGQRARLLAALANLVIVVEAEDHAGALYEARVAQALGRAVGAVPGRVSSPIARGPHALLHEGARLIRDTHDALDVLYGVGAAPAGRPPQGRTPPGGPPPPQCQPPPGRAGRETQLPPSLRELRNEVAIGRDTLAKLTAAGANAQTTAIALSELELAGAVVRGDGGRYLPG